MSQEELLEALLEQGGVMGAAMVSEEGEIVSSRAATHDLSGVEAMLRSCLASNRLLTEIVGAETRSQTILSFAGGVLMLTRAVPGVTLSVVVLTTDDEADRVRFGLRRLLPLFLTDAAESTEAAGAGDGAVG